MKERKQEASKPRGARAGCQHVEPNSSGQLKSTSVRLAAWLPLSQVVQILNRNRITPLQHLERVAASAKGLGFQFCAGLGGAACPWTMAAAAACKTEEREGERERRRKKGTEKKQRDKPVVQGYIGMIMSLNYSENNK